jgi:hypothetical protein
LDTQYAPEVFSSFFLRYFWRPRDAQGRSKAGPRSRKGATRTPQGIPGTAKNRLKITLGYHLVSQGRPGASRGTRRNTRRKELDTSDNERNVVLDCNFICVSSELTRKGLETVATQSTTSELTGDSTHRESVNMHNEEDAVGSKAMC